MRCMTYGGHGIKPRHYHPDGSDIDYVVISSSRAIHRLIAVDSSPGITLQQLSTVGASLLWTLPPVLSPFFS